MVKKIWKDRKGVIAPITAVLAVVLVVALVAVAYMALGLEDGTDGPSQNDHDLDDDGKDDPFIGNINIHAQVKIVNPHHITDDDVQYTINTVSVTLVDEAPSMSIWDGMELWAGDADLKLVCKLTFPVYNEVLIKNAAEEWKQEYPGSWNRASDWVGYHTEDFYSGSVRYHGSYHIVLTLYEFEGGDWVQQDKWEKDVSI